MANTKIQSEQIEDDIALGGNPTTTTQSAGNNTTRVATTAFVTTAVANLVDSAPSALDTLNELAAAMGDDASFSTTITNSIATKLPLAGGTMTGNIAHASDFTIDAGGDIILDTDGASVKLKDGGTDFGSLGSSAGLFVAGTACGIRLHSGGTKIFPTNAAGAAADGTVDLGAVGGAWNNVIFSGDISHSGDLTIDVAGDLSLDADGADINFKDGGTLFGQISNASGLYLVSNVSDAPMYFRGNDGGSYVNAITIDYQNAGRVKFEQPVAIGMSPTGNHKLEISQVGGDGISVNSGADFGGIRLTDNSHSYAIRNASNNFFIYDVTNTTQRVTLKDTGYFGIGQTNPAKFLDVGISSDAAAIDANIRLSTHYGTQNTARGGIQMHDGSNVTGQIDTRYDGSTVDMHFGSLYSGGYNTTSRMVIKGNGKVGIGIDSPAGLPLQTKVSSGDNKFRQTTASKDAFTISLDNSTGDTIIGTHTTYPALRVLDAGGLCFGSDTAASNALDDYEEGSWTPTLPNGGSLTVIGGNYTKIGRQVFIQAYIQNIAPTANTSNFYIGGLPFTVMSSGYSYTAGSFSYVGTGGDIRRFGILGAPNYSYLYFHYIDGTGAAVITNNNWISQFGTGSGKHLIFTTTYFAA